LENFFNLIGGMGAVLAVVFVVLFFGVLGFVVKLFKKVPQGQAIIRTGWGRSRVSFTGMFVIPVLHRMEIMDISVKRVEIERMKQDGLICHDNLRADIKVTFFVGVNSTELDVLKVAQSLGVSKASDAAALRDYFDSKFSDALKTAGKKFDFVDLYEKRNGFRQAILGEIGTDLNGYHLDDAAIDYLEQTSVDHLNSKNILDAEGIKKITELTANQNILANQIRNDEKKTITKQDVEAREAILELERQLAETEEKQHREVQSVKAREVAETKKIQEEQRLKSERARISSDEEIAIAEQNKDRQIIVAQKNKERTDAVETERVKKDQELEATERVKAVTLAGIEKDKAVEEEKKNIQFIIKERVVVEKAVVVEEEKIKDTREWAEADRMKKVAITGAEQVAEEKLITEVRAAESKRQTAELYAKEVVIRSEAEREASARKAEAMKLLAEGQVAEIAAPGLGEAKIQEAKAASMEKEGNAQAAIIERKGLAEASVIDRKGKAEASVIDTKGTAEAKIMHAKYHSEAEGIKEKADAMKILDTVGKDHEEFKLKLDKELQVDLAGIDMQRKLAEAQSEVIREGLKTARIDIVGGESTFFQQIAGAITKGKTWDRMVDNSKVLTDVKETFFNGDGEHFKSQMRRFVDQFAIGSEDIKNLTVAALISKMTDLADDHKDRSTLQSLFSTVEKLGIGGKKGHSLLG
jgi:uncharacterized membrane protein YqiK